MRTLCLIAVVAVVAVTVPAMGAWYELPIANGSFEDDVVAAGADTYLYSVDGSYGISDWTRGSTTYVLGGFDDNNSTYAYSNIMTDPIPDGNQFAELRGGSTSLYQITSLQVQAGESYMMNFFIGESKTYVDMRAAASSNLLNVSLYLVEDPSEGLAVDNRYRAVGYDLNAGVDNWTEVDWGTYTADAAHDGWYLAPYFWHAPANPWYAGYYIDDVRILSTVPEPATLGLLAAGAIGLLARRKRQ